MQDEIQPMVAIRSATQVDFTAAGKWIDKSPVTGNFAVETDRERVRKITEEMIDGKIREGFKLEKRSPSSKRLFLLRWFQAMRSRFLGLPEPTCDRIVDSAGVTEFLGKYLFSSAAELPEPYGVGPVFFALLEGDLAMADALVEAGAAAKAKIKKDMGEIYMIASDMFFYVLLFTQSIPPSQWCIDHGSDMNELAPTINNGALTCCKTPEILKWFVEHPKFNKATQMEYRNLFGMTPLASAAFTGVAEIVDDLIVKHGADPQTRDDFGMTPLFHTRNHDDPTIVNILLMHGVDPTAVAKPVGLSFCRVMGFVAETAVWINPDRTVMTRTIAAQRDGTALHMCAMVGCPAMAGKIIEHSKKQGKLHEVLAVRNNQKRTALDIAIAEKQEVMSALLKEAAIAASGGQTFVAL